MRIRKPEQIAAPVEASTRCEGASDAIKLIEKAIHSLSGCAKENEVAKDSIANLSVVLLDLKSM